MTNYNPQETPQTPFETHMSHPYNQDTQREQTPPEGASQPQYGVQQGMYPPPPAVRPTDYSKIGGFLLTFIILQTVYAFSMMSGFPGAVSDVIRGFVTKPGVTDYYTSVPEPISASIATVTLVLYSVIIIMCVVQLVTRNSLFLRNFQLAGIIAGVGNLITFCIKEVIHIGELANNYDYGYSVFNIDYHWSLVLLAILWTIFWSLYFVRSERMRTFMSPDNPYSPNQAAPYVAKALFGRGSKR
jgi:hypothetical protein